MTNKKLIAELNKAIKAIGAERDRLRNLISEVEDLENTCSDAYYSLESAVDRLSELV